MKYLGLLLLQFIFYTALHAQPPKEKTLLWEVTGNGIAKPSYLFGTIHLMCADEVKMPEVVKQKFNTTSQLFLEVDMDDPMLMMEMAKGMQMHDTSTLQQLMGNDFDSVSNIFKGISGFPLNMMNKAKPMLLMSMVYPTLLGCTPDSWEASLMKLAKEKQLEIYGLEKLEDQIKVMEEIPYTVQADMLKKMLLNLDSSKTAFNEVITLYKQKDINKMHQLTSADKDFGSYEGALLNNRNHNWIPVIGEQAKKVPTFFAFGAGHLGGEQGVINLLRKNGFTVKAIKY